MSHAVAVIGLGVMGQRMLRNMTAYPGFAPVTAWDPSPEACRRTRELYPGVAIAADPGAAIEHPRASVVYIASPPMHHEAHARAAMRAGKAVYCEKPLGVHLDASTRLVDEVEASGVVNIVKVSLASAVAAREVERRLETGEVGDVSGADIRIHFARWPRDWQIDASGWLSYRAQGGFTREVVSHWLYLASRLFGRGRLRRASSRFPDGGLAESHVVADLEFDGIPVTLAGSVGGAGPDLVEFTVWGSACSCRIHDWNRLRTSTGDDWVDELGEHADLREKGYELQLANAAAAISGEPHTMPSFRDALAVQALVEATLSS